MNKSHRLWIPFIFAAVFLAVFAIRERNGRQAASPHETDGPQLVAVLVMSPDCSASDAKSLRDSWFRLTETLRGAARISGTSVHTIGASVDFDPKRAIRSLEAIDDFDEIAVGGGWLNTSVLKYMIRDIAGHVSVPQVVLVSRVVSRDPLLDASGDSLIARLYNTAEIDRWVTRHRKDVVAANRKPTPHSIEVPQ